MIRGGVRLPFRAILSAIPPFVEARFRCLRLIFASKCSGNRVFSEGLGSGQTQQTVNLPPRASKVRILLPPPQILGGREIRFACRSAGIV